MITRAAFLSVLLATSAIFAAPATAQSVPPYVSAAVGDATRPEADSKRDADRKPAESVAFAGVKPGDTVLELLGSGGYYTRILSKTVGPRGHVYTTVPEAMMAARPTAADGLKALAAEPGYSNISVLVQPNGTPTAPVPVDVVWTSLNYHDLENPGPFGAGDMAGFNKAVFAALKPGGTYLVIDHAAAPGSGITATRTLHRIDPEVVKKDATAAGFTLAGSSDVLKKADDDYTAHSTDKDTQFIFKFTKPR
jgi:predicted methyltransferase